MLAWPRAGSGADDSTEGCRGAADGNVVMVTINYRLGILGYLALPELKDNNANGTVGNWGLLDQQLALKWVKDNIAAFGGDPTKVVLYGESAGAYSLLLHMVASGSKGLFSSAVSFSGSADAMAIDFLPDAYKKGKLVAAALNCSTATIATARGFKDVADCLRKSANPAAIGIIMGTLLTQTILYTVPVVDGVLLTKHPAQLMRDGKSFNVPVTLVTNAREGILEITGELEKGVPLNSTSDFLALMRRFVSIPKSFEAKVATQYAKATYGDSYYFAAIFALTDVGYHCPALRAASAMATQGLSVRLMQLQMARPTNGCPLILGAGRPDYLVDLWDAFHSYDVGFTFMVPYTAAAVCNFTSAERDLASFLSGMVSAVAATGAPVPPRSASLIAPQLRNLTWPAWTALQSQQILDFNVTTPKLIDSADWKSKCQIWDDILSSNIALGTLDPDVLSPPPAVSSPKPPGSSAASVMVSAWALLLPAVVAALAFLF
ncbi:hypothetical protein HXX76_006669 [Chlamydomonas incerta]|uniref:Carboxylic ester hydrolase n=1 Tax=Chlamydomonas incerta TaxID=51695 RepID=A0A835W0S0_CHLIN|nr:hypothetical protein HXX76_006669 [Chlamydomonas incerta]|eukprot:KAG2436362.1 hypothetical protein HXX76_006669 [Chlamydomonas incerta]